MEVANFQPPAAQPEAPADASMDIDMDMDVGLEVPEPEPIELDPTTSTANGTVDPQSAEIQHEKVHIRGVDELTTDDIKQFAAYHFNAEEPARIEWIDDTSANIVYWSPEAGSHALSAFTQVNEEEDASALPELRLRSAKALTSHPDSVLQVRSAVKSDRKRPRAYEASRFYLMHPEHDPREKLRRELAQRRRTGSDSSDGDYRRRRFDGRELRRRRDRDGDELIHADMYDDMTTDYAESDRSRAGRRQQGRVELFPDDGASGRLRNRSASPGRDTLDEGRQFDRDSRRRFRERSPRPARRNEGKELFSREGDSNTRELFPNKPGASYLRKELFPKKVSNHRRTDAIDVADETADLFSRRISVPFVDGSNEQGQEQRNRGVELFPESDTNGVSIRGAAGEDQGMSIRGAANGMSIKGRGASVRELFPSKYSDNARKELFSDKIEGRGGPRRRAEDMFG